jgi:tRNA threonylcarbamoyl adenosine modification protein YjeE
MRSKTSKTRPYQISLWKSAQDCAEPQVIRIAEEFALVLKPGDRVFLEGEMGAGNTTFARALLKARGVIQPPEGSPSFAIAHEYQSPLGDVIHVDFYRLKNELEIEAAGIGSYFWERPESLIICEWISMFPEFESAVKKTADSNRIWKVEIQGSDATRNLTIGLEAK